MQATEPVKRSDDPNRCRLSVVENVYYESPGQQPIGIETIYSKLLEYKEQPYIRHLTIEDKTLDIDFGWIKQVGMVVIKNNGNLNRVPTTNINNNLDVYNDCNLISSIPVDCSIRIYPKSINKLTLQSEYSCKVSIHVFTE